MLTPVTGPAVEVRPVTTIPNPSRYDAFRLAHQVDYSASSDIIDQPAIHEQLWTDPVRGIRGFLVIHSLVGGPPTGGNRMYAECTLSEVTDLARRMTLKTAACGLPGGGAKACMDIDPHY